LRRVYDLFVSGGRDSVVAATIGYERARAEGAQARVVFIKEFELPPGLGVPDPEDYVRRFSEWLGAELVVLKPAVDYWEGVKRWGYPMLFFHRWCFQKLKKEPLMEFLRREYVVERASPVWVVGVRRAESRRRERLFKDEWSTVTLGGFNVRYWFPILDWSDGQVEEFIRRRGIPENPAWRHGFSMECLCMAGMTLGRLRELIHAYPRLAGWLAEKDREVQARRLRPDPAYPAPLLRLRMPLHEFVERELRKPKLDRFLSGEPP